VSVPRGSSKAIVIGAAFREWPKTPFYRGRTALDGAGHMETTMACRTSSSLRLPRGTLLYSVLGAIALTAIFAFAKVPLTQAAESAVAIPAATLDMPASADAGPQTIVVAGGCFWGVQGVFEHTKGVIQAVSGYSGGTKETAHYEMVGTEKTGHAESVQITYDPKQISYGKILQIYFSVAHNPTELNYQGPDSGPSYRSAIFSANDEQKRVAKAYIAQLDQTHVFPAAIVTKLEVLTGFYPAENYHQDFLVLHPTYPYIVFNDLPKVENLKRLFPDYYRETPVTVLAASKATQ
jgi:peptide-methionine (S)-S-oxide reductase